MQLLNKIITTMFDLILSPFSTLPPIWGLLAVSFVTGIIMVVIYKYTSNQAAIRSVKDKISAYFMEVRLFKDDLGLMLDAQKRILRTNLTYMKHAVMPMLVMIVPVIFILIQLGIRYANRPLRPGESALVKLRLADNSSLENVSVEPSDGLRMETPLLRIPDEQEVDFRIAATKEGNHKLSIIVGDERVSNPIVVSRQVRRVYPERTKPSLTEVLFAPGQDPLPKNSNLEQIKVDFPPQTIKVLGWNINWLVIFFVASIIAGYSLKGVFGVEV